MSSRLTSSDPEPRPEPVKIPSELRAESEGGQSMKKYALSCMNMQQSRPGAACPCVRPFSLVGQSSC